MQIYQQINEFNARLSNKVETATNRFYYVKEDEAKRKAAFVLFAKTHQLVSIEAPADIIDLAYGSGCLAAHIVLDGEIPASSIRLNDKFAVKGATDVNVNIDLGSATISTCDFLDPHCFDEKKYDIIIFDPLTGGNSAREILSIPKAIKCTEHDSGGVDLVDFVKNKLLEGFDPACCQVDVDDKDWTIRVTARPDLDKETKKKLKKIFEFAVIDGVYTVIGDVEKELAPNVRQILRLRKTIETISHEKTAIFFAGRVEYFDLLFPGIGKSLVFFDESDNGEKGQSLKPSATLFPVECRYAPNLYPSDDAGACRRDDHARRPVQHPLYC